VEHSRFHSPYQHWLAGFATEVAAVVLMLVTLALLALLSAALT